MNKPPRSPGRRVGARNKISTALLESFAKDFEEHGDAVIQLVRMEEPATYLKLAFTLLPAVVEIKHDIQAEWRALMGWATELPNLQARIAMAIGGEAASPTEKSVESDANGALTHHLRTRSWAADAHRSPSVTPTHSAPPSPALHDDPNLTFHPPKEPPPQGPKKDFYLGNPAWPQTNGVLDSDRQGTSDTGFARPLPRTRR